MKKVLGLAAAGLLAAGAAQAGNITVANSDITLYGGVSASYDYVKNDYFARDVRSLTVDDNGNITDAALSDFGKNDNFRVSSFAIGLMKKADENLPIGFNVAFARFEVPTVIASADLIAAQDNDDNTLIAYGSPNDFKPWLAYVSIAPVEGFSIDAGLLWNKFGEAPLTILNRHYTRGILFTGHPVVYKGVRANYDAGIAQVYVGYNQGGGLRQGHFKPLYINGEPLDIGYNVSDAFEAGITFNLSDFVGFGSKIGLHTYNEAEGRNLYVLCTKADLGLVKTGIEIDYTNLDDKAKIEGADDSALGVALNIDVDFLDAQIANVTFPVRIEYVNNGDGPNGEIGDVFGSGIYLTGEGSTWSFTITPTWKPTKNTFARVEAAYVKAKNDIFIKDDNKDLKDSNYTLAFEAGFLF